MDFPDLNSADQLDEKCISNGIITHPVQIALQDPIANNVMHQVAKHSESHNDTRDDLLSSRRYFLGRVKCEFRLYIAVECLHAHKDEIELQRNVDPIWLKPDEQKVYRH